MASLSNNALYKTRTLFAVELHPSTVGNVLEGVKEQLNAHLLRYVDEFDGVLLSYSNVEILTKKPVIHPYFPYFHLDVRADVLVFKPAPGMALVGRVNHLGEDYLSALVLGVFNVTIPARSVIEDLHFLREEAKWIHVKQPQHQIAEHSYLLFKVEEVRDHGGFFQITGSLRDPGTGAVDFLHPGIKLPEPPTPDWAVDTEMLDGFAEPATTTTGKAAGGSKEVGKDAAAAAAAPSTAKEPTRKLPAAKGATANGGTEAPPHNKRKRELGVPEEPKGKRRRKLEEGKGGAGPSGAGGAAAAAAVAHTAAAVTPAPASGVHAGNGAATAGQYTAGKSDKGENDKSHKEKGEKKKEKYKTRRDKDKTPKEKDKTPKEKDKTPRDKRADKDRSEKKKGKDKVAPAAADGRQDAGLSAGAAAPASAFANGPGAGAYLYANGGAAAAAGVEMAGSVPGATRQDSTAAQTLADGGGGEKKKHKDKDGKESSKKKDGKKESGKKDGKREGKELSKKKSGKKGKKESKTDAAPASGAG